MLGPLHHSRAAIANLDRQVVTVENEFDTHLTWLEEQLREA